ncbi:hypothetical protein [Mycolicibacterium fluoranthenivorans]|uniref:Uncharacterized protein n=1 Tax=Mycolicibacterium fluoranthenivorans TaxID=258505 RepID=A0A7X5ZFK2_9MYCO|nr:hypothetical protein [Mycolicibacterium fluoranthenivorans]MCV7355340.1 hypothetical protein [Mycolicibacterium fluoranthenivorans]NIH98275.1 hypothetical protein [Mycolicibacterium fluoranthenivorans]
MVPTTRSEASENVSGFALEVLDELRIRMMESRLALQALAGEAELNFDELDEDLQAVQDAAREAFEAASLVHQGAPLDSPWADGPSRPRAIFARHNAAVRQGAHRVDPLMTMACDLERALWQLRMGDDAEAAARRPRCAGTVRTTGEKCVSAVIHLGGGLVGTQCYSHATPAERNQYKVNHEVLNAQRSTALGALLNRRRDAGVIVMEHWLQYREARRQRLGNGFLPL